jgi:magnesium chelatase family protein
MENIVQVVEFLSDRYHFSPVRLNPERIFGKKVNQFGLDFSEVKGQARVKRAMEIAASGSHNLLMLYAVSPQN